MKILNVSQIRSCDAYTIENEPISSVDLMERAAYTIFTELLEILNSTQKVYVFCGKGNNGGDGLVIARLLLLQKFDVHVYIVHYTQSASPDFETNLNRLKELPNAKISDVYEDSSNLTFDPGGVIIDALWGSGLNRPIRGFATQIIEGINQSGCKIISIDMPSGSFCDQLNVDNAKVKADLTFSFYPPKLAMFIPENEPYFGKWEMLDIGLSTDFISSQESNYELLSESFVKGLLLSRSSFDYKNTFGHALMITGSYGKIGASVLCTKACLRAGAGLVSAYVPSCGYAVMQMAVPEAMVYTDQEEEIITMLPEMDMFNVVGAGPGIGTHDRTAFMLHNLLKSGKALVLDADALNILAKKKELLADLPENSILTPHVGEFDRLAGKSDHHFERLEKLREFCLKYKIIVVLKGKFSAIGTPKGKVWFNPTGNPGMATAGSGDVLTGIITGLRARGYTAENAAITGVFLHGLAGDLASEIYSQESLIAGDLINYLPKAFLTLQSLT